MMFLPSILLLLWIESLPFEVCHVGLNVQIWERMMYILRYEYLRWKLGYLIDSLDLCYAIELVDSRGDIGVIYA